MRKIWGFGQGVLAMAFALGAFTSSAGAESVLRVVPQNDLKILDPIFTTAQITGNHGNMIYDTLMSLDADLAPQPQMVESYGASPHRLLCSFTLRPRLKSTTSS